MEFFLAGLGNYFTELNFLKEGILEADRLGFDGALIPDHYMWGRREGRHKRDDDYVTVDSWVMLTYLAAKTEQIRLGTRVTPIPFRPPGMLAKMVATLDNLSNGRVVLGVGAGWSQEEFEAYSKWHEPKIRVDKTIEGLELMIQLWTQDEVTFEGQYYRAKAAVLEPKPIQKPYPALFFGSQGTRMLRLAGRYGNICFIPNTPTPVDYEERKKVVMRVAEKLNRVDDIGFMIDLRRMLAGTRSRNRYDQKEYFREVEAAVEMGASYFQATFPRNESFIESIRSFSREIMSSFK